MTPAAPPIFIVGSGRSGTSILRAALNAHPDIHLAQESALVRWLDRWPDLDGRAFRAAWEQTASGRLQAPEPVQLAADATPADAIRETLVARARSRGKPRWGDKTPLHALHLDLLWRTLPDARVIAMIRHPVPTVASLRRMPWGSGSVAVDAVLVQHAVSHLRDDPRLMRLRLEDLLDAPEDRLRDVLDFVAAPWDDRVLDPPTHADFSGDPRLPWLTTAESRLAPAQARSVPLSPGEVGLVERICPPEPLGYARWERPAAAWHWPAGLAGLGRTVRFLWAVRKGALPSADPAQLDAHDQLRWLLSLNPDAATPELATRALAAADRSRSSTESPS